MSTSSHTTSSQSNAATRYESLLRECEHLRLHVSHLERDLALAALPEKFGFKSPEGFMLAFKRATGVSRRNAHKQAPMRATITPEMLDELIRRDAAGESPAEIARALNIAEQTVRNKRSLLGITRDKKRATAKQK